MGASVTQQSVTANQLWKNSGTTKDFTTWINDEKILYDKYAAKQSSPMTFLEWEEDKLKKIYNVKSVFDIANSLLFKTQAEINQKKVDSVVDSGSYPTKRILGMPKPLFYTAIGVVAVGMIVTTIYLINKRKK
jgi:hypothetical protein